MQAIQSNAKVNKKKPDLAVLWNNKGAEFFRNNQFEEAKAAFNQAKAIKPNLVPALYNLANVYVIEGKGKEAIFLLQKAIETDPNFKDMVKKSSCFDKLRNDQDFKRLIH
jgi:Flp pilus assembly protein TadD